MTEKPTMEQLISDVKNHQDWRVRQQSIQQLGEYDTTEAMDAIATALYDDSPHVTRIAAYTLAMYGKQSLNLLKDALTSVPHVSSRKFILDAFRKIGDQSVVSTAIAYLEEDNRELQGAAILILEHIPDERSVDPLIRYLAHASEHGKSSVAKALGAIASPTSVVALTPLLQSVEQSTRRYSALALGRIGNAEAAQALIDASQSEIDDIRYNAAEGLGLLTDERAFNRLVELTQDKYALTRGMAAKALAKFDSIRAEPHLNAMLNDPDKHVHSMLRIALGLLSSLDTIPTLMQRFRNDGLHQVDGLYRFSTIRWDYPNRGEHALNEVLQDVRSDDYKLRTAAVWVLYQANSERWQDTEKWRKAGKRYEDFQETEMQRMIVEALINTLADSHADVRLSALIALMRSIDKRAIDNVIELLDDTDPLIIQKAIEALGLIGDTDHIPHVLRLIESSDKQIRYAAIRSLGTIGDETVVENLIAIIDHPDDWTRIGAASSLIRIGDQRSIPVLLNKLENDSSDKVRAYIIKNIAPFSRDLRMKNMLIKLLQDPGTSDDWSRYEIRSSIMHILALQPQEDLETVIYHEIDHAPEWQLRMSATQAAVRLGTERDGANRMFQLLNHENETVRTTASEQLGYLGAGTQDLKLRDYIVDNLIQRLQDTGRGYHYSPTVAHMAAKSLYYVGTPEANEALRNWELKRDNGETED